MVKEANIMLRVDAAAKRRIEDAARVSGKSITDFVLENTMKAVAKAERSQSREPTRVSRGACPTFFRACCATASAGGSNSYKWAAYELTRHLSRLGPWELDEEAWLERLAELSGLLESEETDRQIIDWFEANLPRCMALVPKRRQRTFVEGVREYVENREPDWA